LRHLGGSEHLDEEFGCRRGDAVQVFAAGVAQYLEESFVVDQGKVEDAGPLGYG
jgi:hypothetical protein